MHTHVIELIFIKFTKCMAQPSETSFHNFLRYQTRRWPKLYTINSKFQK